ncbi:hypothetical protein ACFZDK_07660 [Streptomyces sp. NPDC007901]|uniref:hypothetical protein n=1 Tax=Streptomyces sp. NPDC007901 TaxID=3364785 RepID=UPI0036F18710
MRWAPLPHARERVRTAAGPSAVWDGGPDKATGPTRPTWHKPLMGWGGQRQHLAKEASKQ